MKPRSILSLAGPLAVVLHTAGLAAQVSADSACANRLVGYAQRASMPTPEYSLELAPAGGGHLLYLGALHSSDPAHPQFAHIQAEWERVKPTVVFYEGPPRSEAATAEETIRQFGESGLVRFLARRDGARIERLEDPQAEVSHVARRFPVEQVKLFYILREVARLRERRGMQEPELRAAAEQLLRQTATIFPEFAPIIRDTHELEAAYRRHWTEPAAWWQAPTRWFTPMDSSAETGGIFTNDINRASSEYRNLHMYRAIAREVKKGERVFAVVGRDHIPAQAPALRCALR